MTDFCGAKRKFCLTMLKRLKLYINLHKNSVFVNFIAFSTVIYHKVRGICPILFIINYLDVASCTISAREEILRNPPKPVERIDAYRVCIPSLIIHRKTSRPLLRSIIRLVLTRFCLSRRVGSLQASRTASFALIRTLGVINPTY